MLKNRIILALFIFTVIGLTAYTVNAQKATQPHYNTIPQCHGLTKPQCIQQLKQQITTAKQAAKNYWEGVK